MVLQSHPLHFPFLTLPDPAISGEGRLDPLGLAVIADGLADWILPGMTARMIRPRFLTAMAVSAVVCEGLEEAVAADGVTPAFLVFEWLLVEGFARAADLEDVKGTAGIGKAREAKLVQIPLCARSYLKAASVMGFHGIYGRLARHLGIVDHDLCQGENGHALVKLWEREQLPEGFSESGMRQILRSAVMDGLRAGCTQRSAGWNNGWAFFAQHLNPSRLGKQEADFLFSLLLDGKGETRGEIFRFFAKPGAMGIAENTPEDQLVHVNLLPEVSPDLATRFRAIVAYEKFCALIENAFDWLRYLSSQNALSARALPRSEFATTPAVQTVAADLSGCLREADQMLADAPDKIQREFSSLQEGFTSINNPEHLYDSLLARHCLVQKAKPPEGKREWFEPATDGSVFVRVPYRLMERPEPRSDWPRPYRLSSVRSFCRDLLKARAGS